jgi:hypothetical protein
MPSGAGGLPAMERWPGAAGVVGAVPEVAIALGYNIQPGLEEPAMIDSSPADRVRRPADGGRTGISVLAKVGGFARPVTAMASGREARPGVSRVSQGVRVGAGGRRWDGAAGGLRGVGVYGLAFCHSAPSDYALEQLAALPTARRSIESSVPGGNR